MDNNTEKRITIDQVAALCGVSKTTVSRFLNGKFDNISADTRERIAKVVQELNYRPNRSAQRLKASRSMLIGCVLGDVSSPFSSLLLRGISKVCEAAGYQILFSDSREDPDRERRAIQGFLENRVDGLIINTTGGNDELIADIHRSGIPIALADRMIPEMGLVDTVVNTDVDSAYEAVRFLLEQGYEKVAFINEAGKNISPRYLRKQGYEKAMSQLRPEQEYSEYMIDTKNPSSCLDCVRELYENNTRKRIAVLSGNGVAAHHILMSMNQLGLVPGYDFGLLTFDDWLWLRLALPGISTVALESEKIGAQAAKMVISRASGERTADAPGETIFMPTKLIVRGSTPAGK